jgi:hypothetical protein
MSKTYGCLPSELLGIEQQPTAFYFDRAIYTFCQRLENEMDKAGEGKSDRRRAMVRAMVMNRWLGAQTFASPKGS